MGSQMEQKDSQFSTPVLYYHKCISLHPSIIITCDFIDVYLVTMASEKSHKIPLCSTTNYDASMEISCKIIITLVSYDFFKWTQAHNNKVYVHTSRGEANMPA